MTSSSSSLTGIDQDIEDSYHIRQTRKLVQQIQQQQGLWQDPEFPTLARSIEGEKKKNVKCRCGKEPVLKFITTKTGRNGLRNYGKGYWGCSNTGGTTVQNNKWKDCGYFRWAFFAEQIQWYRFGSHNHHVLVDPTSGFKAEDLVQGKVGDCWFLSALSVIAERDDLIRRLFPTLKGNHNTQTTVTVSAQTNGNNVYQLSKSGLIEVYLFLDGKWRSILIDNFLPCIIDEKNPDKGTAVSNRTKENKVWSESMTKIDEAVVKSRQDYERKEQLEMEKAIKMSLGEEIEEQQYDNGFEFQSPISSPDGSDFDNLNVNVDINSQRQPGPLGVSGAEIQKMNKKPKSTKIYNHNVVNNSKESAASSSSSTVNSIPASSSSSNQIPQISSNISSSVETDPFSLSKVNLDAIVSAQDYLMNKRMTSQKYSQIFSDPNDKANQQLNNNQLNLDPKTLQNRKANALDLAYSKTNNFQTWVSFLEKAYAKAHGSYQSISGGEVAEAFLDLTGFPTLSFNFDEGDMSLGPVSDHNVVSTNNSSSSSSQQPQQRRGRRQYPFDPKEFWGKLKSFYAQRLPMGCGTSGNQHLREVGLVGNHAYSILEVREFKMKNNSNYGTSDSSSLNGFGSNTITASSYGNVSGFGDDGRVRLLKIRNPHGSGEWKGDWSDQSGKWQELLRQQDHSSTGLTMTGSAGGPQSQQGLQRTEQNDGVFYIDYDHFLMAFSVLDVCLAFKRAFAKSFDTSFPMKKSCIRQSHCFDVRLGTSTSMTMSSDGFNSSTSSGSMPECIEVYAMICQKTKRGVHSGRTDRKKSYKLSDVGIIVVQPTDEGDRAAKEVVKKKLNTNINTKSNFNLNSNSQQHHLKQDFHSLHQDYESLLYWSIILKSGYYYHCTNSKLLGMQRNGHTRFILQQSLTQSKSQNISNYSQTSSTTSNRALVIPISFGHPAATDKEMSYVVRIVGSGPITVRQLGKATVQQQGAAENTKFSITSTLSSDSDSNNVVQSNANLNNISSSTAVALPLLPLQSLLHFPIQKFCLSVLEASTVLESKAEGYRVCVCERMGGTIFVYLVVEGMGNIMPKSMTSSSNSSTAETQMSKVKMSTKMKLSDPDHNGLNFKIELECRGMICRTDEGLPEHEVIKKDKERKMFQAAWRRFNLEFIGEKRSRLLCALVQSGMDWQMGSVRCSLISSLSMEQREKGRKREERFREIIGLSSLGQRLGGSLNQTNQTNTNPIQQQEIKLKQLLGWDGIIGSNSTSVNSTAKTTNGKSITGQKKAQGQAKAKSKLSKKQSQCSISRGMNILDQLKNIEAERAAAGGPGGSSIQRNNSNSNSMQQESAKAANVDVIDLLTDSSDGDNDIKINDDESDTSDSEIIKQNQDLDQGELTESAHRSITPTEVIENSDRGENDEKDLIRKNDLNVNEVIDISDSESEINKFKDGPKSNVNDVDSKNKVMVVPSEVNSPNDSDNAAIDAKRRKIDTNTNSLNQGPTPGPVAVTSQSVTTSAVIARTPKSQKPIRAKAKGTGGKAKQILDDDDSDEVLVSANNNVTNKGVISGSQTMVNKTGRTPQRGVLGLSAGNNANQLQQSLSTDPNRKQLDQMIQQEAWRLIKDLVMTSESNTKKDKSGTDSSNGINDSKDSESITKSESTRLCVNQLALAQAYGIFCPIVDVTTNQQENETEEDINPVPSTEWLYRYSKKGNTLKDKNDYTNNHSMPDPNSEQALIDKAIQESMMSNTNQVFNFDKNSNLDDDIELKRALELSKIEASDTGTATRAPDKSYMDQLLPGGPQQTTNSMVSVVNNESDLERAIQASMMDQITSQQNQIQGLDQESDKHSTKNQIEQPKATAVTVNSSNATSSNSTVTNSLNPTAATVPVQDVIDLESDSNSDEPPLSRDELRRRAAEAAEKRLQEQKEESQS